MLPTLNDFLGGTWLECCGYLSQFTIEGHDTELAAATRQLRRGRLRIDYWIMDDEEYTDVAVSDVLPVNAVAATSTTVAIPRNCSWRTWDAMATRWTCCVRVICSMETAVLARNEPDKECVAYKDPARWRLLAPDYETREPIPFCDGCRPEAGRN